MIIKELLTYNQDTRFSELDLEGILSGTIFVSVSQHFYSLCLMYFTTLSLTHNSIASNDRMTVNDDLRRLWKKVGMTYLKAPTGHVCEDTEENRVEPQSVFQPEFEMDTHSVNSNILLLEIVNNLSVGITISRNINHHTALDIRSYIRIFCLYCF
jgi:hypothetical protein